MARQIKFKWGWYLLFAGPVLALLGVFSSRRTTRNRDKSQKPRAREARAKKYPQAGMKGLS